MYQWMDRPVDGWNDRLEMNTQMNGRLDKVKQTVLVLTDSSNCLTDTNFSPVS